MKEELRGKGGGAREGGGGVCTDGKKVEFTLNSSIKKLCTAVEAFFICFRLFLAYQLIDANRNKTGSAELENVISFDISPQVLLLLLLLDQVT